MNTSRKHLLAFSLTTMTACGAEPYTGTSVTQQAIQQAAPATVVGNSNAAAPVTATAVQLTSAFRQVAHCPYVDTGHGYSVFAMLYTSDANDQVMEFDAADQNIVARYGSDVDFRLGSEAAEAGDAEAVGHVYSVTLNANMGGRSIAYGVDPVSHVLHINDSVAGSFDVQCQAGDGSPLSSANLDGRGIGPNMQSITHITVCDAYVADAQGKQMQVEVREAFDANGTFSKAVTNVTARTGENVNNITATAEAETSSQWHLYDGVCPGGGDGTNCPWSYEDTKAGQVSLVSADGYQVVPMNCATQTR